jgi:hypothetical protein
MLLDSVLYIFALGAPQRLLSAVLPNRVSRVSRNISTYHLRRCPHYLVMITYLHVYKLGL